MIKFTHVQFASAFFLSVIAAWFSVAGLVAIFPGAPIAIGLMALALEFGKLVTASWLYRFWKRQSWMRYYFVSAVVVLSLITSLGVFGYLSRAHFEGKLAGAENVSQIALIDSRISSTQAVLEPEQRTLTQFNRSIDILLENNRVTTNNGAVQLRNAQREERDRLHRRIDSLNAELSSLRTSRAELAVEEAKIETEIGPLRYLAQFLYGEETEATTERVVRWLILAFVLTFDPLAILLFASAVSTPLPPQEKTTPVITPAPETEPEPAETIEPLPVAPGVEPQLELGLRGKLARVWNKTKDIRRTKRNLGRLDKPKGVD